MNGLTIQSLKSLKSLTDYEARILIEIMKKGQIVVKKDMRDILKKAGCCDSKTRGYDVIKELEHKKVVIKVPNNDKAYRAIDPRQLLIDCKNSLTALESEIIDLETPSDAYDFEEFDPRAKCCKIEQEHEIITTLHDFKRKNGFTLSFYYKENDNKIKFWKDVKDNFGSEHKKGKYNCVVLENKEPTSSGVLILSKRADKQGTIKMFGHLIMDYELAQIFVQKRGGKK